jgi:hypothetical protein
VYTCGRPEVQNGLSGFDEANVPADLTYYIFEEERATTVFSEISCTSARQEADIVGAGIYAWGDLGPHPETFWLGYAVGASAPWHPGSPDPHELMRSFYRLFYDAGASDVCWLYQLMSTQAQVWESGWDGKPGGLVFGYSYATGPLTAHVSTLPAAVRAYRGLSASAAQLASAECATCRTGLEVPGRESRMTR